MLRELLTHNILSLLVFLPLLGAVLLYVLPFFSPSEDEDGHRARGFALSTSLLSFILSVWALNGFDRMLAGAQLTERAPWIPSFGVWYAVGVDGISLPIVLLVALLVPLVIIASTSIKTKVRGYVANLLVLETAMLGALVAQDLLLFFVFWELMVAPMCFIIGIWGGKRRIYSSLKYVLFTVTGSLLMFVGILFVVWRFYEQHGEATFLISDLLAGTTLSRNEEIWLFAAFALACGIKVPIFPFHSWLPDAMSDAPSGAATLLAGKMGLYGLIRFAFPLFPRGAEVLGPVLAVLAVVGIIYGALVAWYQTDMKRLLAFSSLSHYGYCVLGIAALTPASTSGALFQILSHGVCTGAILLLVGALIDRKKTRQISDFGGLADRVPVFSALLLLFILGSIALPLTNGFVGEFLILSGSFSVYQSLTCLALLGVILGAVYMLSLYMRVVFGEIDEAKNGDLQDLTTRELCTLLPLLAVVFFTGILPNPLLSVMESTVQVNLQEFETRKGIRDQFDATKSVINDDEDPVLPILFKSESDSKRENLRRFLRWDM